MGETLRSNLVHQLKERGIKGRMKKKAVRTLALSFLFSFDVFSPVFPLRFRFFRRHPGREDSHLLRTVLLNTTLNYNLGIALGLCGVYVHCGVVLNIPRPGNGSKTYSLLSTHKMMTL
jgi:hypothetical protein